jgi:transposase
LPEALKTWLDTQAPQVLPESLLGKAISYTRNQWEYLSRYVIDGCAPVDNNLCHAASGMKQRIFWLAIAAAEA